MKNWGYCWLYAGVVLNSGCNAPQRDGNASPSSSTEVETTDANDAAPPSSDAPIESPESPTEIGQTHRDASASIGASEDATRYDDALDAGASHPSSSEVAPSHGATSTPKATSEQATTEPQSGPRPAPQSNTTESHAPTDTDARTEDESATSAEATSALNTSLDVVDTSWDGALDTSWDAGSDQESSSGPASSGSASSSVATPLPTEAGVDADTIGAEGELPALTSLEFVGAYAPLYPDFDPNRSRYSIIGKTANAVVSVLATSTGGAQLRVNGIPLLDAELTELSLFAPGSELVFTLGDEPGAPQYIVQYLPHNFPQLTVANPTAGASQDPLYISLISSDAKFVTKLDEVGVPLFYKGGSTSMYDFKKHADGTHSYAQKRPSSNDGSYQILLDSEFRETAQLSTVGLVNTDVHDFLVLPNGNRVFIAEEPAVHDLTSFGLSATQSVRDGMFQEVTPDQQVVFQWNSWDHFQYDESVYAFETQDYAHLNSITLDHDDNWLLSSRGFSQVLKIDRTTGAVIWRLGGISSDFTFVNDPYDGFCGQHTAQRLDNGHILLFDNARDCLPEIFGSRPDRSRAVEYALDEGDMTAEVVWSYERDGAVAASQGSVQRLSNGNTMIGWGSGPNVLATEVTAEGEVAYELTGKARNGTKVTCYRARRFAD